MKKYESFLYYDKHGLDLIYDKLAQYLKNDASSKKLESISAFLKFDINI